MSRGSKASTSPNGVMKYGKINTDLVYLLQGRGEHETAVTGTDVADNDYGLLKFSA